MKRRALLFLPLFSLACGASSSSEQFSEHLTIKPLSDGRVSTTFSFNTVLEGASPRDPQTLHTADSDDESQHYTLFPLPLGQLLREYAVTELHLTLNAGRWNYDAWGYPDEPGVGAGAELWAWMGTNSEASADIRWKGLRNALGGLFCASLGSLDDQHTTSPILSFQPQGFLPSSSTNSTFHTLRHISLPSENVCTENLTPFLKLLPCKSYSGLSSLLNPHHLFDADWHGMGVHVLWIPDRGVQVRLTFQAVMDPLRLSSSDKRDWSLQSLFGRTISQRCPVAHTSEIRVELPVNVMYSIQPEPHRVEDGMAKYDLKQGAGPLDLSMRWANSFQHPSIHSLRQTSPVPIAVDRTLKGTSQASGELSLFITNRLPDTDLKVLYLETMPWHLHLYLHTATAEVLRMTSGGRRDHDDLFSLIDYIPSIPHSRPTTLQAVLRVPADSTVHVKMDVAKSFLRYTEYPPDAQRGWDLPPAVFTVLDHDEDFHHRAQHYGNEEREERKRWRVYTRPLLVDLATPDFSMPYNVIIFTCSLIAFLFGTIFNLLTRKFVEVRIGGEEAGEEKEKVE